MKRSTTDYIAGLFVIAGFVLIIGMTIIVRGQMNKQDSYFTYFSNVAGLKSGAAIIYEGYIIGSVTDITPETTSSGMRFKVDLGVKSGWQIPEDSKVKIAAQSLLSAQAVQIKAGVKSPLPAGSQIASTQTRDVLSDLSDTADELSSLAQSSLQPLLETLTSVIDNEVRTTLSSANNLTGLVEDKVPDMLGRLDAIFVNLEMVSAQLEGMLGQDMQTQISQSMGQIEGMVTRMNNATTQLTSDQNVNRINDSLMKLEETASLLYRSAEQTQALTSEDNLKLVEAFLSDAMAIQTQVADIMSSAELSAENTARLTSISQDRMDSFLQRLENAALNIEEMTARLRDDPSIIIRGSN